jgi:cell division protein FtsB
MAASTRGLIAAGLTPKRILIVAAFFIVAYFGVLIVSNAITHMKLARDEAALRVEIATLQHRQAQLNAVREYMKSDTFIEAAARQNGLVKPGESAVVPVGPGAGEPPALRPDEPWWMRYLNERDRR